MIRLILVVVFFLYHPWLSGQPATSDTTQGEFSLKAWHQRPIIKVAAVPLALGIIGGSMMLPDKHAQWSKFALHEEFLEHPPSPRSFDIEDHLRNVPIAMVYSLDALGVPAQNSPIERSLILAKGLALQGLIVSQLKRHVKMERPDGGLHSFPSSHTARAFAAASFMQHEYGEQSPWYTVAGYSFAVATAGFRLTYNYHWWPDVLIGAGIGMLSMNLAYATHRFAFTRWMHQRRGNAEVFILPQAYKYGGGISLNIWY